MKLSTLRILVPVSAATIIVVAVLFLLHPHGNTTKSQVAVTGPSITTTPQPTLGTTPVPTSTSSTITPLPTSVVTTPTPHKAVPTATRVSTLIPTPNTGPPSASVSLTQATVVCETATQTGVYPSFTVTNVGGSQLHWQVWANTNDGNFAGSGYVVTLTPAPISLGPGQSQTIQAIDGTAGLGAEAYHPEIPHGGPGPSGVTIEILDNGPHNYLNPIIVRFICSNIP